MILIRIFLSGLAILIGAIILNYLGSFLGLTNWYEFIQDPSGTSIPSYIWLCILYPFGLGLIPYLLNKIKRKK